MNIITTQLEEQLEKQEGSQSITISPVPSEPNMVTTEKHLASLQSEVESMLTTLLSPKVVGIR